MRASPGNSRRLALLGLLLVAVLFAIYRLRGFTQPRGAGAADSVPVTPAIPAGATSGDQRVAEGHGSAAVAPSAGHPTSRDRAVRDEMREKIYRGFGRPLPQATQGTKTAASPFGSDAGRLDRVYIQKRIQEDFVPLAKECYEAALERDAKLAGKLVFSFVIAGDEDVGGIVESAEIDPSSTLVEKELVYCLRESLLSLSFEPPKQGGVVTVTYPFVFSPDGPDPDSGPR
jgi:hypothetical protein